MSWQLRSVLLVAWASATCALPAGTKLKAPRNWRTTFDLISELRADRTAVVDQMGTEAITKAATAEDAPFHALVSLMLSSQTKDTVNLATMQALREATKQTGLTPASILAMSDEELDGYIYAVGFHNRKVEYLKRTSQLILEKHNGIVPDNMDDLLAFPGVGPKMAIILIHVAYGRVEGISVDTHVHRISNELGWTGAAGTKQPEQTRKALESWMPKEVWGFVNLILVGFGQELQTQKPKLLRKVLRSSDPTEALRIVEVCGLNVNRELVKAKKLDPELVQEFEGYLCARGKESNAPDATAKPPMKKAKTPAKTPAKAATDAAPKAAAPAPPKPKHPPIEMQKATVAAARALSENGRSRLLELEGLESAITYEPGHVLMLEAEHQPTGAAKGPYTVVRADTKAKKVTLVYRVVAEADGSTERPRKTAVLEQLAVGDSATFGGSFHEPILRGVAEKAKHAFLISTGVGIAPLIGFVEQCVARWGGKKHSATTAAKVGCDLDKITLFAGFREMGDLVFLEELEKLSTASGRRFEWYGCISGKGEPVEEEPYRLLRGRHTVAAPPLIRAELSELDGGLGAAHFHIIGNGQAVKEWSQALEKAGVPEGHTTVENYFNFKAEAVPAAVDTIVKGLTQNDS